MELHVTGSADAESSDEEATNASTGAGAGRVLRSGVLFKRGRGWRQNWKRRLVQLTPQGLYYYQPTAGAAATSGVQCKALLGSLLFPKATILNSGVDAGVPFMVERVPLDAPKTGSSESSEWRFRVTVRPHAAATESMLFAAASETERRSWATEIEQAAASAASAS